MNHKINIQAVKLKSLTAALLFAIVGLTLHGQPQIKIADGRFCEGDEILLPVIVDGFEQISSFTLYLGFDTQTVTFVDVKDRHEQFNTGSLMSTFHENNGDPMLIITWIESNNNPATVPAGALFHLQLEYTNGTSDVFFKSGCEISIGMSPVAEAGFVDGSVGPIEISVQPEDQFVAQDQQATFNIQTNGAAQYHWMLKAGDVWSYLVENDRYQGVDTDQLIVINTPKDFDSQFYRCEVSVGGCSFFSEEAMLNVSALSTGELIPDFGFEVYPNPFTDELNIRFHENRPQLPGWKLLTLNGEMIAGEHAGSNSNKVFLTGFSGLSSGVYLLQVFNDGLLLGTTKILKH
jgi:hypothetical protein